MQSNRNVTDHNPAVIQFNVLSASLSLACFLTVFPVWVAGNHQYGALSRVWQEIDMRLMLLVGFIFLVGSFFSIYKSVTLGGKNEIIIPAFILALTGLQFFVLSFSVILKTVFGID